MKIPLCNRMYYETLLGYKLYSRKEFTEGEIKILKEAYDKSHDFRKFEIELYWKRNTYFWTILALIIGAFGYEYSTYMLHLKESIYLLNMLAISFFGFMINILFLASCIGGRYWQANWENNVELLEHFFSGNLYKINLYKKSKRYSVSRINENVLMLIMIAWCALTIFLLGSLIKNEWILYPLIFTYFIFLILMLFSFSKNEDNTVKINARKILIKNDK